MNSSRRRQLLLALITLVAITSTVLVATARSLAGGNHPEAWVGTWATAVHRTPPADFGWPVENSVGFKDQTIRMVVRTSVGGTKARVRLSNRYGAKPLMIGHATVALPWLDSGPGDLRPGTIHEVSFAGQRSVTVPPGGVVLTDPITMDVPALGDVAISIYLPGVTGPPTLHNLSRTTSYIGTGDHASSPTGASLSITYRSWYYISALDVLNRSGAGAIVVMGDSITDGNGSTNNTNRRWTNFLAARLHEAAGNSMPGVLNVAMGGNRLGEDGGQFQHPEFGESASARFAEDVLSQSGARAVIIALGINDIWITNSSPDLIISHLLQLSALAHQAGLEVFVCTLGPWKGLVGFTGKVVYSSALDSTRLAVNSFIRTNTTDFDGIIDFDAVLRDTGDPLMLRADFEPRTQDHIHPNDAGLEAMAKAVPLEPLLD
jgi:lysophospholipase L1-like esterase